jgi:hypothetical protein
VPIVSWSCGFPGRCRLRPLNTGLHDNFVRGLVPLCRLAALTKQPGPNEVWLALDEQLLMSNREPAVSLGISEICATASVLLCSKSFQGGQ